MLGFLLLRFLAFLFVWVTGYEFWFLPNLFDESLSFVDSFKPVPPSLPPSPPPSLPPSFPPSLPPFLPPSLPPH
jgi:hypothetical protein